MFSVVIKCIFFLFHRVLHEICACFKRLLSCYDDGCFRYDNFNKLRVLIENFHDQSFDYILLKLSLLEFICDGNNIVDISRSIIFRSLNFILSDSVWNEVFQCNDFYDCVLSEQ